MHKLFLDIETLPAEQSKIETLRHLFDKKNPQFDQEKFDEFVSKTNFDGAFGRILCIGYAVDDEPAQNFYNENNEKETLQQFWHLVDAISSAPRNPQYPDYDLLFVGHNVMDFDLRFIYQRSIVLGVKPAYDLNFARYRSYPVFDTMKEWVKWANSSVSLDYLAYALDVPSSKTGGIDGSQVAQFFADGKVNDILEYCKRDVETTRAVYRKMVFEKPTARLF
ncbi:MAG: ribonuclease H-like domain-containing protein [Candidatus Moranbacteria bacterium]|nr:ribonuclease H-like domain-containing protein [Candidatus Moranbacteria bacterium]